MGSLKDEIRGLREDHKPCEKTESEDGECPGGSDGRAGPEGPQIKTSQVSTTHGDYQPTLHMNASYAKERDKNPISKDQVLSEGLCDNSDQSDSIGVKDSELTDTIPLTEQPEGDNTTATQNNITISNKFLSDGDGDGGIQGGTSKDKNMCHEREKGAEIENILVPEPPTPVPSDPRTPAPFGQNHMHTQVSLEVVQCRSAATSPMTPPEAGHSFFFPSSFGRSGAMGTDTKDAELQVGQQVEFCSVATSPMTPKTPSTTAFPELIGRETAQEGIVKKSEGQQGSFTTTKSPAESESEITGALKFTTSKELSEGFSSNASRESSASCTAAGLRDSQVTLEDSNQQCKQQRMGSMDQDITILVTHHGNNGEEEEELAESSFYPTEPEMVKIDEYEELGENNCEVKREDGKVNISTELVAPDHMQDTLNANPPQHKTEESSVSACNEVTTDMKCEKSDFKENKGACEELRDLSVTKPPVPESPAPFGCHNIRTQVSLEVVQCQSAATSPMTPPEGDHAFYFPSSVGRCGAVGAETKDAELQVGQQVEFRSVATAPMTPRTPTTTTFPEIRKEVSIEEKIVEEEEDKKEQVVEDKKEVVQEEEKETEENMVEAAEEDALNCKEKGEEPVQEVSWDEKGMTWEVYGAVVEVTVLGSAIQKHLEKQVKKRQPSMPPPPPLNPSAMPLSTESTRGGSGKGRVGKSGERDGEVSRRRRNPFRLLMENMQQPHCCSKAHTSE
ncbi:G protein-regulated inducer of neurite outgrowth 3 [Micropterus dolomieu]|uniref:G protein-regulated inducer of neurite outgrowth 3 n=1 Tax=Micropterus dolomieu TaxID=147949 RepID=UPI001E8E36BC|nr:G protein-regulated inducer of neurite outgrowth 3 [Micropterus dolomieu]XP_045887682.1 G protein-regulated inducer of neurite outgrowth 3 [Micropterus dolomieu]